MFDSWDSMKCREIKAYLDKDSGLDISKRSRKEVYVKYRAMYYFLCAKYASDANSYSKISKLVGKDHASFINGLKTFESFMISDSSFKQDFSIHEAYVLEQIPKRSRTKIKKIDSIVAEVLKGKLYRSQEKVMRLKNQIRRLKKDNNKKESIISKLLA